MILGFMRSDGTYLSCPIFSTKHPLGCRPGRKHYVFSFVLLHVGLHPGLAGYLAMVIHDAVELTEWCLLSPQFLCSIAARSAPAIVFE